MITCEEAARLISDSLDQKLPLRLRIALRMHLLMCRICPRFSRQLIFLRDAVNQYREEMEKEISFVSDALSMDV